MGLYKYVYLFIYLIFISGKLLVQIAV